MMDTHCHQNDVFILLRLSGYECPDTCYVMLKRRWSVLSLKVRLGGEECWL